MAAPSDEGVGVVIKFALHAGMDPMGDRILVDRLPRSNVIVSVHCSPVVPDVSEFSAAASSCVAPEVSEFSVGARRSFSETRGLERAVNIALGMGAGSSDEDFPEWEW